MTSRILPAAEPHDRLDALLRRLLPRLGRRARGLAALILLAVLAQALFWGVFYSPLSPGSSSVQVERLEFTDSAVARLDAPTAAAADAAAYQLAETPHTDCCAPAYLALKLGFDLAAVPAEGLGIASFQQVDNFIVRLNGSVIHSPGRMTMGEQTFHGQKPLVARLPAGLLQPGRNEISIITVRQGLPYSDLYPPMIGPWSQIEAWSGHRLWVMTGYRELAGWTTFVLGLFGLLLMFRSEQRRMALWLTALCWGWTAYAVYGLWLGAPVSGLGRLILFFAVNSLVPTALLGFIDAWTGRPLKGLQPAAALAWTAFVAACVVLLTTQPAPRGYDWASLLWAAYLTLAGLLFVARLVWHFITVDEARRLEAAVLSIVAVCIILDAVGAHFGLDSGGYLLESAPVLLLGLGLAFVQRNLTLFQSSVSLNRLLADRLAEREDELRAVHERERERVREQAGHEERRRIMRDMHDGPGGELVSLLLASRRGAASQAEVAEGLQSVIDEIRLMVDSMDSVGESLTSALAVFRQRMQPRIEAAGFAFVWRTPADVALPDYAPRTVLQVFRILQEAVTNALKHSGGARIEIGVDEADQARPGLFIRDDGRGPGAALGGDAATGAGRGMANMRRRAEAIGGELTVSVLASGGAEVRLRLPPGEGAA